MERRITSPEELADFIKDSRKGLGLTQRDLAGASGLGERFIGDLERGKSTCQIGKALQVLAMLGIELEVRTRINFDD
ncbi:MAG TPA: helix-turn-helix transcriptional regulator [Drouetiella sp.]